MNIIIKRGLAFFLSFTIIFSSTSVLAASPVGWATSPAEVIMNGATATITAVKGAGSSALQSTVKHAPAAGRIAKHIVKVGGVGAVAMAIAQILGDGINWVMDPANNRVKYTVPHPDNAPMLYRPATWGNQAFSNPSAACNYSLATLKTLGPYASATVKTVGTVCHFNINGNTKDHIYPLSQSPNPAYDPTKPPEEKYLPYSQVAQKIISNAATGEPNSQELVKTVAIEDFNDGVLDTPLNTAAVPKADAPSVPDPNNPPWTPDQPVPPFDPSSIIAAIKSVMAAVVNMSGVLGAKIDALMIDLGLQNDKTNQVINDGMADVVAANDRTGARVGDVVAAIEGLEGNTLDGQVINDAIDKAIEAGHTDKADIVAAIEAIQGNTLTGEVINEAIDRVISENKLNSDAEIASADAAASASDAIAADAAAAAAQAAEDAKAAADAKAASDAEFKEWAMEDAPPADADTTLDIPSTDVLPVDTDINFGGSCPANFEVNSSIFGNPINITLFDTSKFCSFLSTFVKFPVYAASSLFALYILGGRKDV